MKVLLFGATGGTGRCLVEQALERGHEVTAYVRDASKLELAHASLQLRKGELLDADAVDAAVRGHDAVLSALGIFSRKPTTLQSDFTKLLCDAMTKHGVRRLVYETSLGVGDSHDRAGFVFLRLLVPLVLRHVMDDKERQEALVRQSGLDWVLVRPGGLTNGPRTGRYHAGLAAEVRGSLRVSRADVAHFMLEQLESDAWLRKAPCVLG